MSKAFDPYHSWLGIAPEDQPPNHYRLLGLTLLEKDREVISNAADQRMAYLRTLKKPQQLPHAQRLLNEISQARVTLLNEKSKAAYDENLRSLEADPEPGDLTQESLWPAVEERPLYSSPSRVSSSVPAAESSQLFGYPKSLVLTITGSLVLVLLVGIIVITGRGGDESGIVAQVEAKEIPPKSEQPKPVEMQKDSSQEVPQRSVPQEVESTEVESPEAESSKVESQEVKPKEVLPNQQVSIQVPQPQIEPEPEALAKVEPERVVRSPGVPPQKLPQSETIKESPRDPFHDLAEALELPLFVDANNSTNPVVLANIYPKERDLVGMKLIGGAAVLGKLGEFSLANETSDASDQKWIVNHVDPSGRTIPIGKIAYKSNEVTFAWTGSGQADLNNRLRFCKLRIFAGLIFRVVSLSKPIVIEPLAVEMDQDGTKIELPMSDLPEDLENVTLEITQLVGFPEDVLFEPPGRTIKSGETLDLMFPNIDLAFRAKLEQNQGGKWSLDFRPMIRGEQRGKGGRPLKPYLLKQSFDQLITEKQKVLVVGTQQYEQFKKQSAKNKQLLVQAEVQFQKAMLEINEQIRGLQDLKSNIETLAVEGKVHFLVKIQGGDSEAVGVNSYTLELLKTKDLSQKR